MLLMRNILGQERATATLQRALQSDRLHHAWIFHGPEGVGKRTAALAFAAVLLDPDAMPNLAGEVECDPDGPTLRRIAAGTHPDLHLIVKELARFSRRPEVRNRKLTNIPNEVVREFIVEPAAQSSSAPSGARVRKVFIVDEAEILAREGQNSLLKTLEEPPPGTVIILITTEEHRLLPTIRSRCQRLRFTPLHEGAMQHWFDRRRRRLNEDETPSLADLADDDEVPFEDADPFETLTGERVDDDPNAGAAGRRRRSTRKNASLLERRNRLPDKDEQTWLLRFAEGSPGMARLAIEQELFSWYTVLWPEVQTILNGKFAAKLGESMHKTVDEFADRWVSEHPNASKERANRVGLELLLRMLTIELRTALHASVRRADTTGAALMSTLIDAVRTVEIGSYSNISNRWSFNRLVVDWADAVTAVRSGRVIGGKAGGAVSGEGRPMLITAPRWFESI